ncbi:MAG: hypothetical protein NZ729_08145 [Methylococcales bacterium]|jgi:transcriptional regulator GlxA family with amidase domain|nr:hypothetical protein [Methylococcales bacterium]MEE2766426.1 hypothetical protein [Pseudomonadota bacterium]
MTRKNETRSSTFDLEAEAVAAALDKAVEMLHWNNRQPIELYELARLLIQQRRTLAEERIASTLEQIRQTIK